MTKLSLIVAMGNDRLIGIKNQMPWHLPADLKHFKAITLGKPVIMGRKTYESIGKPLPKRHNIVVTRNQDYQLETATVVHDLPAALKAAGDVPECMIIGGAQLYKQALPLADTLYLTFVDVDADGDAYFPAWPADEWQEVSRESHRADERNPYNYTFVEMTRK